MASQFQHRSGFAEHTGQKAVDELRRVRHLGDGNIVTSSNLTAGIDATLHVVDRFAGRATALDGARQIGSTHVGALDDPRFAPPGTPLPQSAEEARPIERFDRRQATGFERDLGWVLAPIFDGPRPATSGG